MTKRRNNARRWMGCCGWLPLLAGVLSAETSFAPRYERIFLECQALHQGQPTNAEAAWRYARACFDCSMLATNQSRQAELAKLGITAARASLALRPDLAAAHYYLGINLGQLANVNRSLSGLMMVSEMERSFLKARELEAAFDFGGPDRCLGLLYRDAPGWPISVGNRAKARRHLEQARQLAGDYPENRLNLLESWLKWGEKTKAAAELENIERVLVAARAKLTGEEWGLAWAEWDRMWRELKAKATQGKRPAASPKGDR